MKIWCAITLVLLSDLPAGAQDSLVMVDGSGRDTVEVDFLRFQIEASVMGHPEFGLFHAGIGLNLNTRKQGWYNHFSFLYNGLGNYDDGLLALNIGKKYQYTREGLFVAGGFNAGAFLSPWEDEFGLLLTPDVSIGIKTGDFVLCAGGYFGVAAAWWRIPKQGPLKHRMNVFGWFDYYAVYSPYVKVIFYLGNHPKEKEPKEPETAKPVDIREPFVNEADSTRRQFGVTGFGFSARVTSRLMLGLEANFPAKKHGWYNSVAVVANTHTSVSYAKLHSRSDYYLLGFGKKYELMHEGGYYAFGLSVGMYYNHRLSQIYPTNSYGVAFTPHIEAGANLKRLVIAAGVRPSVSAGYFETDYMGNPQLKNWSAYGIEAFVVASPYIKIILK